MKILTLTIKKKYFDQIKSGEKKIEYRRYAPYYISRLVGKSYDGIKFLNGYKKESPMILVEYHGYVIIDCADTPLGDTKQFAINLGKILK